MVHGQLVHYILKNHDSLGLCHINPTFPRDIYKTALSRCYSKLPINRNMYGFAKCRQRVVHVWTSKNAANNSAPKPVFYTGIHAQIFVGGIDGDRWKNGRGSSYQNLGTDSRLPTAIFNPCNILSYRSQFCVSSSII